MCCDILMTRETFIRIQFYNTIHLLIKFCFWTQKKNENKNVDGAALRAERYYPMKDDYSNQK